MTALHKLTATNNYFEDFSPGLAIRHERGKTIGALENVLITNMVMNTAQGHFNEDIMRKGQTGSSFGGGGIISYGGVNFSMVLGLASQDCVENAICELGLDNIRLSRPVTHGDTLYAYSEVLEKKDSDREDAGIIVFRHYGYNQRDEHILTVDRTVLMKRKSHWGNK